MCVIANRKIEERPTYVYTYVYKTIYIIIFRRWPGGPQTMTPDILTGWLFQIINVKEFCAERFFFSLADASVAFSFTRAESFFFTFSTVVVVVVVDVVFVFVVPKRIFLFFRPKTPRVLREDAIFTLTVRFGWCISWYIHIYLRNTHRTRLLPDSNNTGRRSDAPLCVVIYTCIYCVYYIPHNIPFMYPSAPSSHHRDGDGNATDDRPSIGE